MASLGAGAQGKRRKRAADLMRHSSGRPPRPHLRDPGSQPAAVRAAHALAQELGDAEALEPQRIPSMDYLCSPGGQMFAQAGALFCRWD